MFGPVTMKPVGILVLSLLLNISKNARRARGSYLADLVLLTNAVTSLSVSSFASFKMDYQTVNRGHQLLWNTYHLNLLVRP
jgi:hypothetical protein